MASKILYRASAEERLVFFSLVLTYPVYLVGGLYVLGSILGWMILAIYLIRLYVNGVSSWKENPLRKVSPVLWLWIISMLVMLLALIIAHLDRQLSFGQTAKSSIGWAKGWALLALFPLLGSMINIRPEIIARGCCTAAACAIPFALIGLVFYMAGHSGNLYTSPLKVIGGPTEVFQIKLFGMNPETGMARWPFIGPWAPGAGLMSCFYLVLCLQEKNLIWKILGVAGALTMCVLCQSRAGWGIFLVIVPVTVAMGQMKNPLSWVFLGVLISTLFLLGEPIIQWLMDSYTQIKESRPGSTRVRGALARLATQRWEYEAPIWGHGIVEKGPKIVEHMPIGTHHSWYGLLFVKGIVGLFAFAVPLALTSIFMLWLAQKSHIARTAMAICVIMVSYSFFENLEILAYLYWPALLWIGISLNPTLCAKELIKTKANFHQTTFVGLPA